VHVGLVDNTAFALFVATEFVKRATNVAFNVGDSRKPLFVSGNGTIKDLRFPFDIGSHDDMGQGVKFLVSVRAYL
jgi:hypothetical protein